MVMPKMGESIMEGTILSWLKKEGDTIEQDESVLEVATDKVDTEVPATHGGVLKEILAKEGDVVPVGKAIAVIDSERDEAKPETPSKAEPAPVEEPEPVVESVVGHNGGMPNGAAILKTPASGRFYSPLVLNIARKEMIPMEELEVVPGTGKEGRVTKKDILNYVKARGGQTLFAPETFAPHPETQVVEPPPVSIPEPAIEMPAPSPLPLTASGEDEIIEMDRMRKMIAERMLESKRTSPHVTSFVEADVTPVVHWRNRYKTLFKERENENLTFTPIFVEAVVAAIKDYPMINISVDGDSIIKKKDINIGIAVALPTGNLIVPVIHQADQYNIIGLAKRVNDLARRARNNQLKPDDLSGGTFTISNVGSFGNVMGTPIIMQPQVAIMAFGAVVKKPSVIESPQGDTIGIRHKMFLSHSYDHRVVDGALGGMFVRRVADYLEKFDVNRKV